MMLTITLNLPQKRKKQLEKDFKQLETLTEKSKDFHTEKAVIRYLEHADKLIRRYEQEKTKSKPNFTKDDLLEHLNLKEIDWKK